MPSDGTETPLFGLEEEVFLTHPDRPALDGLWSLSRLMWKAPRRWYTRSASNFARGREALSCLMSGVEISTGPCPSPESAVAALAEARSEFANVANGYIVAMGALPWLPVPTNTCGLHVHVGGIGDRERAYRAIAHFLPLLACLFLNSPYADGPSYRLTRSYAIGPLGPDPKTRFQDLILPRRLPTVEIRCFDSCWDLERVELALRAIRAIVTSGREWPLDLAEYGRLRGIVEKVGYNDALRPLYTELCELLPLPEGPFRNVPADGVRRLMRQAEGNVPRSAAAARVCRTLDGLYRDSFRFTAVHPSAAPNESAGMPAPSPMRAALGLLTYYLPKAPYVVWKAWVENAH